MTTPPPQLCPTYPPSTSPSRKSCGPTPASTGDAQRIEQFAWMLFFKIFSDKDKEL
ncbi:MAG: hypothetical protein WKG07_30180 [Hymenobacter sp.]